MSKDVLGNALEEISGPFKDFFTKLGGPEGSLWMRAFKRFLRKENPWAGEDLPIDFPAWMTVELGIHPDPDSYHKAIMATTVRMSNRAKDILQKVSVGPHRVVQLVRVTVAELGFSKGARYEAVCERAKICGLRLCPAEVGPALRMQYLDQPFGEWLRIAMEPITASDGDPVVFAVYFSSGGLWLETYWCHPDLVSDPYRAFVFVFGE